MTPPSELPESGSLSFAHEQLRRVGHLLRSAAETLRAGYDDRFRESALASVQLAKDALRELTEARGTGRSSRGESRSEVCSRTETDSFRLYSLVCVIEEALLAPSPATDDLVNCPISDALDIAAELAGDEYGAIAGKAGDLPTGAPKLS